MRGSVSYAPRDSTEHLGQYAPSSAYSARMGKIANNWEGELFERRIVPDELLQKRDGAGSSRGILAGLAEAAKVEERVDRWILDLLSIAERVRACHDAGREGKTYCSELSLLRHG